MQKQIQIQEQQAYTEEDDQVELEKLRKFQRYLIKKGIVMAYVYHCNRCNYVWFPKDFDAVFTSATNGGLNLILRSPPKACARCKNKYWNSPPKWKTRNTSIETAQFSTHTLRSMMGSDKMEFFGHDMISLKRVLSDYRATLKRIDKADKEIIRLKKLAKEFRINIED